ncbi:hypothetical protein [uncultured Draconibacterium sp.]
MTKGKPGKRKITIRYRDTMKQERVAISELGSIIGGQVNFKALFGKL